MKKSILSLDGVKVLSKTSLEQLNGGCNDGSLPPGYGVCADGTVLPCNVRCKRGGLPFCAA